MQLQELDGVEPGTSEYVNHMYLKRPDVGAELSTPLYTHVSSMGNISVVPRPCRFCFPKFILQEKNNYKYIHGEEKN